MPPSSVKLSIGGGTVRLRRNVGQVVNLRPIVNRPARDKKGCLVAPMPLRGWQSCRTILRGAQRNDDLVVQALISLCVSQPEWLYCTVARHGVRLPDSSGSIFWLRFTADILRADFASRPSA